jgi:hypothetical protein
MGTKHAANNGNSSTCLCGVGSLQQMLVSWRIGQLAAAPKHAFVHWVCTVQHHTASLGPL